MPTPAARLAIVLLSSPVSLEADPWVTALAEQGLTVSGPVKTSARILVTTLQDGTQVGVAAFDAPLPEGELDGLVGRSMLWPGSEGEAEHTAHLVVTVRGGDRAGDDHVGRRLDLSRAAVATARLAGGTGIYWGEVPTLSRTDIATQILTDAAEEQDLPVVLWVSVALGPGPEEGRLSALTRGLTPHDHPELWITTSTLSPQELWSQAMSIAGYVLNTGARLQPGQTLGESADDRHPIVEAPSPDGSGRTVLRIDLA